MKRSELYIYACLIFLSLVGLTRLSVAENKYAIKQMTPDVQSALDSRRSRFTELEGLKASGDVGENNQGYVEALTDNADVKSVVEAENQNRKVIYETIAQQNGLEGALETIEKVFAQVQRDKAAIGVKIQNEDGSWTTKQ